MDGTVDRDVAGLNKFMESTLWRSHQLPTGNKVLAAMGYITYLEKENTSLVSKIRELMQRKSDLKPLMRIDGFTYEDLEVPSEAHTNWEISVWGCGGAGSLPVTMVLYGREPDKRDHSGGKG